MAIEKLKITIKAENKTWITPQINNHIKKHELGLIRPQT
jgi:hypothetical protein